VLLPEFSGSSAIKILLIESIRSWLADLAFPCEVLASVYSVEGERLLGHFDFLKIQDAKAMPDHLRYVISFRDTDGVWHEVSWDGKKASEKAASSKP
jgi:hypothetical protein